MPSDASSVESRTLLTGGAAIVEAILRHKVDTVFGLPGAQIYPLVDALHSHRDKIRTYTHRHEQSCGYAAFGYARSTGKPGVFFVVPGPGILNATGALCTAMGANAPVLCLTGQVPSEFFGKGRGHLHELSDQLGTMRTLVKWAGRISRPQEAFAVIDEAFKQMTTGRPGPVVVEMAWDLLAKPEACVIPPLVPYVPPKELLEANQGTVDAFVKLASESKRPMILCGSGAQGAAAEIQELSALLTAPVAGFRGGRGIVPESHPTASDAPVKDGAIGISSFTASTLFPKADLVIGFGTRLEMPMMRWDNKMMSELRRRLWFHLLKMILTGSCSLGSEKRRPQTYRQYRPQNQIRSDRNRRRGICPSHLRYQRYWGLQSCGRPIRRRRSCCWHCAQARVPNRSSQRCRQCPLENRGCSTPNVLPASYSLRPAS